MYADAPAHFTEELGFSFELRDDDRAEGRATIVPELCTDDTDIPRAALLLTYADIACGIAAADAVAPRVAVTVDLRVHVAHSPGLGPIEVVSTIPKSGRTVSVGETHFTKPGDDRPFAVSVATFMASPRPVDVFERPPGRGRLMPVGTRPTLAEPFANRVGIRVVAPGEAEVDHRRELSNATNTIQGGLIALVGEVAAETLARDALGTVAPVRDLDVRYLRAARVGPARASAQVVHAHDGVATVRVEVRDRGADDRLVALVTAVCRA